VACERENSSQNHEKKEERKIVAEIMHKEEGTI
jgi:hypothetical protein